MKIALALVILNSFGFTVSDKFKSDDVREEIIRQTYISIDYMNKNKEKYTAQCFYPMSVQNKEAESCLLIGFAHYVSDELEDAYSSYEFGCTYWDNQMDHKKCCQYMKLIEEEIKSK